jgi:hypothetical protein
MAVDVLRQIADSSGLILHHWDGDGICSAAILLDYLEKVDLYVPPIGQYFLTIEERAEIRISRVMKFTGKLVRKSRPRRHFTRWNTQALLGNQVEATEQAH